ncbi:MAG TPA: insulinase family protein [Phaeodactylibacter sp.]|nr:insulinase family protein [Phaeodactylibacter sp.]
MIDRSIAPPICGIEDLVLPTWEKHILGCGIPLYVVNMGTQDALKVDFICFAGRPYETKKMVARATLALLKEGTTGHSAADIAELLDFYGSSLHIPVNLDTSNIELVCLSKHFDIMAGLLAEIILQPTFPEQELENYKENSRQRLQVELAEADNIAYRHITECLFGDDHPYGYNSSPERYAALCREDLILHWKRNYVASRCRIVLSGKVRPEHITRLNDCFGKMPQREAPPPHFPNEEKKVLPQKIHIPHQGTIQTAIRIGRRLYMDKRHPDFRGLLVLNTILGAYFGSRLMMNIREAKGYTYNIYSTIDGLCADSYFCIATEVSTDKVEATKIEIYKELQKLCDTLIEKEELEMVRSYMLGNMLSLLDGPFNVGSIIKTMVSENLDEKEFERLADEIRNISPQRLRTLARQHLAPQDMWEVTVGAR